MESHSEVSTEPDNGHREDEGDAGQDVQRHSKVHREVLQGDRRHILVGRRRVLRECNDCWQVERPDDSPTLPEHFDRD